MSNLVRPLFEMPAHTCTLIGCFGCPFNLGYSHSRWKLIMVWFSSKTKLSTVKMTLLKCSASCRHFSANSSRLTQFGSRISWQYLVAVHTQPSFLRSRLTLSCENCFPNRWLTLPVSSGAVISSFFSISESMKFIISILTPSAGRPVFGAFSRDCLSSYLLRNLIKPHRLIFMSSSARIRTISVTPFPLEQSRIIVALLSWVRKPIVCVLRVTQLRYTVCEDYSLQDTRFKSSCCENASRKNLHNNNTTFQLFFTNRIWEISIR